MTQRSARRYTLADRVVLGLERALRTALGPAPPASETSPGRDTAEGLLDDAERRHVAGLVRVDHAGEVAAQALYHGQGLAARSPAVRAAMARAGEEENAHLAWCRARLGELGAAPSRLDPLWYAGAFGIGALAGLAGDRWSLGFVAETERQVVEHLEGQLDVLPAEDQRTRAILERMRVDEARHATGAVARGAAPLPAPVRAAMRLAAKVMTVTAYRL